MDKGGGSAPATPSYSGAQKGISNWISDLEVRTEDLNNWWMREYQDLKTQSDSIYSFQFDTAQQLQDFAVEDRERYEEVYKPLQDQIIYEAQNWDSDAQISRVRGEAVADVATAFDANRENALRQLEGYGIDPSSTRHQALDVGVRTEEAKAKAFGANAAARQREAEATILRQQAAEMGAGLPEQASREAIAGSNVGSQAISQAGITTATGGQGAALTAPLYGMQGQGYGMKADIITQDYQNKLGGYSAQEAGGSDQNLGGVGAIAGGVIGGIYGGPAGAVAGSSIGGAAGSMITYKDGGVVKRYAEGGATPDPNRVEGSDHGAFTGDRDGGETADDIPALLSENEFVIPADVVKRKGTEFFDGLIVKTRGGKAGKAGKAEGNKLAEGGQAIPTLPGPVASLPPRVQTGTQNVPSATRNPTIMPTARYQYDAALDALAMKYGSAGVGA